MSQNIDYSKGIYDARQLGAGRMLILGVQHMFAMFGAKVLPFHQFLLEAALPKACLSCLLVSVARIPAPFLKALL